MHLKDNVLISACLTGINCRYNGKNSLSKDLTPYIKKYCLIPVCPEQLGGLATPREKSEISGGNGFSVIDGTCSVYTYTGNNITNNFIKGANEVLNFAKLYGIRKAYFKDKSPSCGVKYIYNNKSLISGVGVTTALLIKNNIEVLLINSE